MRRFNSEDNEMTADCGVPADPVPSVASQMRYMPIGVGPVSGLGSGRATAYILLVLNHRDFTHARDRRTVSGVGLGVGRRIALKCGRRLAIRLSSCDHAMQVDRILVALQA